MASHCRVARSNVSLASSVRALCGLGLGLLFSVAIGAGCQGQGLQPGVAGDVPVAGAARACPTTLGVQKLGAGDTVLRVEGDSPLRGARIEIPAGALPMGTTVRLGAGPLLSGGDVANLGGTAHGPSLCVETDRPSESQPAPFDKPALLVMPYDPALLGDKAPNYLAMVTASLPGLPPQRKGDILLVDAERALAGSEIRTPGIYQIITVGTGRPAASSELSVLFVLDNSGSMVPKQKMLAALFPQFFDQVTRTNPTMDPHPWVQKCVQYNIGVITTDVGTTQTSFGDNGQLINQYCDKRQAAQGNWSADALDACNKAKCAAVPPLAKRYIARDMAVAPSVNQQQFQCMAVVGDGGSGVEQPLESLSRALSTDPDFKDIAMMRKGRFFRPGGLNSIVFLTDEGDCSMDADPDPMTKRSRRDEFFSPTLPCDAKDPAQPSCYANDLNYRCLGTAIKCKQSLLSTTKTTMTDCEDRGAKAIGLKPAQDYATDVTNYILDLNANNKDELKHLFVRGIWPLRQGAMMIEPQTSFIFDPNNRPSSNTLGKEAFCFEPSTSMSPPTILGHPQVRLNSFVTALTAGDMPGDPAWAQVGSICDSKDRETVLKNLADTIVNSPVYCPMSLE